MSGDGLFGGFTDQLVAEVLRDAACEPFDGVVVYEDPEMMPGAWEIREGAQAGKDGRVVDSGVLRRVTGYRFMKDGQEYVFAGPVADGNPT